jgi:hypothetical protein
MQPDDIDKLFRGSLEGHRTPPPRDLWERLEDELHPPKKRRAAWWPMAIAAVVALLLVAGGAGIWGSAWQPAGRSGGVATTRSQTNYGKRSSSTQAASNSAKQSPASELASVAPAIGQESLAASQGGKAAVQPLDQAAGADDLKNGDVSALTTRSFQDDKTSRTGNRMARKETITVTQNLSKKSSSFQATRPSQLASTPSNAGRKARQLASPLPKVSVPGPQSAGPAVAAQGSAPAPGVPAASSPTLASATPADVIEVDVRRGGGPKTGLGSLMASAGTPVAANSADEAEARPRRGLLRGGLGRQLDGVLGGAPGRVVRTARQGLNALQALPDNLTVQARVGERTVSKTLEL